MQAGQGCSTGVWQTLGVWKRGLESLWRALDSPTTATSQGSREGDAAGKGHGAPPGPPVSSWVHAWNQLLSSCGSTTTWGPRGTILFPVVLEEGYEWDRRGWDGCWAL